MKKLLVFLLVLAVAPVATLSAQDAKLNIVTTKKPKSGGANVITQEEIEYAQVSNAYDAIQHLRPRMLQKRVGSSMDQGGAGEIVVYVDNSRFGYPDVLNSIQADKIKEIRFISAADATQRFGTGHTEGAIVITTRKQ